MTAIQIVCKLLGISFEEIGKALRFKFRNEPGSNKVITSPLSVDDCIQLRDSLSKGLYNNMFNWLVKRLNFTVLPPEMIGMNSEKMKKALEEYSHIGLLDIFGFEIMPRNSIEQLCINYTNERLQKLYIKYIFEAEEIEFAIEGLKESFSVMNFENNQPLLDVLDSHPLGIFQLIDESSSINHTDDKLLQKILTTHKTNSKRIWPTSRDKDKFTIKHTASEVNYHIVGFRIKNKDEVSSYINQAVCGSTNKIIVRIWKNLANEKDSEDTAIETKSGSKATDKFLGAKFRMQIRELITELESCECNFVRCLKPNTSKKPRLFVPTLTLKQIIYMGILDTIYVRKESFPYRLKYKDFYEKYVELDPDNKLNFEKLVENNADFKDLAMKLISTF